MKRLIFTVFATVLITSLTTAVTVYSTTRQFPDVDESDWFYNDVNDMVDWGVIKGNDDGTFQPDGLVNRAQLSAMWNRYDQYASQNSPFAEAVYLLAKDSLGNEITSVLNSYHGQSGYCEGSQFGAIALAGYLSDLKIYMAAFPDKDWSTEGEMYNYTRQEICN